MEIKKLYDQNKKNLEYVSMSKYVYVNSTKYVELFFYFWSDPPRLRTTELRVQNGSFNWCEKKRVLAARSLPDERRVEGLG